MAGFFRDILYLKSILVVLLTPILLSPLLVAVGGPEAACAYVVIIMAVFWVTEALPISVTAFLPVFMFPMVGVLTVKQTAQQYVNATNMLFVGGLIVAAAIEHWNIHRRIALKILLLVGSEPRWLMLGLMAPTWFLSMWISNTATTAMMVPIAQAILMQLKATKTSSLSGETNNGLELEEVSVSHVRLPEKELNMTSVNDVEINVNAEKEDHMENKEVVAQEEEDPHFKNLCKALSLCIAYAANVGGVGSLTGTGPNLVLKGQLDIVYEKYGIPSPITFANWMAFGVPTSLVLVIIVWIWLQIFFLRCGGCCQRSNKDTSKRVKEVIRQQYEEMGPISFGQGAVIGHFIVLAVLWITRDMGGEYGWGAIFKSGYIGDAVPAVLVATLLFIFPSELPRVFCLRNKGGTREPLKPLLDWNTAVHSVPWGVMFLLGGGFAMAHASQESGLSQWLGDKLSVLDYLQPWVLNLVLCYIVAAATEVTSNTATCTLMMPILANLAIHLQQNPMYLMFPSAIATSFAFMLPVATPPNAVVFSYGHVRVIDMVLAGFLLNVVGVLVLIGSTETLGNRIYNFHSLPEEIAKLYAANATTTISPLTTPL